MKKLRVLLALLFFWSILPALPGWAAAPVVGDLVVKESPWIDVRAHGAVCDNVTDDSAAVAAATTAALVAGAELRFPAGWCYMASQWVLSSDNNTVRMKPLKIVGAGSDHVGVGNMNEPTGGTVLRMTYGSGPKISTKNVGRVEITGINFYNSGTDNQAFIYTEGTTLHLHHNAFWGGTNRNDGIIFGGTTDATGFQGYGTVVESNLFQRIIRAGYFRRWANAIVFTNNNIFNGSGGEAAIELDGISPEAIMGNFISGNLIEMPNYTYGVKMTNHVQGYFSNGFFDGATPKKPYYLTNSTYNFFVEVAGYGGNIYFVSSSDGLEKQNTILRTQQGQPSGFGSGPVDFTYGYPNIRVFGGYGSTLFSGDNTSTWRKTEYLDNAEGRRNMNLLFYSDNGALNFRPFEIRTFPDASWVNTTTDLYSAYTFRFKAAANLEHWGDYIWFKNAAGTALGYWYLTDLYVSGNGKGVVLKNAAGTLTKRVRLNDTGDGLIFEAP